MHQQPLPGTQLEEAVTWLHSATMAATNAALLCTLKSSLAVQEQP